MIDRIPQTKLTASAATKNFPEDSSFKPFTTKQTIDIIDPIAAAVISSLLLGHPNLIKVPTPKTTTCNINMVFVNLSPAKDILFKPFKILVCKL